MRPKTSRPRYLSNPIVASALLLMAFLVLAAPASSQQASESQQRWRNRLEIVAERASADLGGVRLSQPASVMDPLGDTFGTGQEKIDVIAYSAKVEDGELVLAVDLSAPIDAPRSGEPRAIDGFFEIDVDSDESTGGPSLIAFLSGAPIVLGVELVADLLTYDPVDGSVDLIDRSSGLARSRVSVVVEDRRLRLTIPTELLEDDDGLVDTAALLGTLTEPTDVVPNVGAVPSDDTVLFLGEGRFRIEIAWTDFLGNSGAARVVPFQGRESGLFYFFDPDNWEMLVKVLNGCTINDRYWVFFAATTNVEFRLRVEDLTRNAVNEYTNDLGQPADAVTDTAAFATCP